MGALNLAGRAGRWSAEHWKRALFGWLVFAVAAMLVGSIAGHVQMKDSEFASGEVAAAMQMLERAGLANPATENVLIQSHRYDASSPAFVSTVAAVVQTLALQPDVTNIQSPMFKQRGGGQISRDGHSALVQFDVRGDANKATDKIEPILAAVTGAQKGNPDVTVREVGNASASYEIGKAFSKDFANAERLTIPLTLLILLGAFGALVAAGLPVLLALSAVLASLGLYSLVTHAASGDYQSTSAVILLVGMAVGIDYSLFYLRREREERAGGREPRAALLRAASTSGQAVLISGVTVLIAMAGHVHREQQDLHVDGVRDDARGALRRGRLAHRSPCSALEARRPRRPGPPPVHRPHEARGRRVTLLGLRARPRAAEAGHLDPARGRAPARGGDAAARDAHEAAELHGHAEGAADRADLSGTDHGLPRCAHAGRRRRPGAERAQHGGRQADPEPQARSGGDGSDVRADADDDQRGQHRRGDSHPDRRQRRRQALARRTRNAAERGAAEHDRAVDTAQYAVSGETAATHDFNEQMKSRMPWVLAFVLGLAFVLLLATFRSVVIPLTAIALNLLSVAAATDCSC